MNVKEKAVREIIYDWLWGDKGYGYLPFAYIERYMMDAWSSVDIEDPNPLTLASIMSYRKQALV